MESPGSWSALTASLAACDLTRADEAWGFLTRRALVRDEPGDRALFSRFVQSELERGPITGPSVAQRVSIALSKAGLTLPAADAADPWGEIAKQEFSRDV